MPDTPHCDATTPGLFDQLLGPCLNPPGHPKDTWHCDARGTEWREYEPPETTTPDWEHKGDGIWTLTVEGGTVLYTTRSTPEERARFAEEWAKGAKPKRGDADGAQAYEDAIECAIGLNADCGGVEGVHLARDAVLAVRDREMERLGEELDKAAASIADRTVQINRLTEERDRLAVTLDEVLRHFVHPGHPGEPCLQTGWISVKTVDRWRAIAYPTKGGSL